MHRKKYFYKTFLSIMLTASILFSAFSYALPAYAIEATEDITAPNIGAADNAFTVEPLVLSADDVPEVISFKEAQEKGHVLRLRAKECDDNTVVFLNNDNTETMYVFAEPVKYTDEYGNKKDKSTALSLESDAYTMSENDVEVSFARDIAQGVTLRKEDVNITMVPVSTKVNGSKLEASANSNATLGRLSENKMVYSNVFQSAELVYTPLYSGFKEDIVLESYNGVNEFAFIVNTNGLCPIKQENGSVWFYNTETDEVEAKMMQVVCYDSARRFAGGDVRITEVKENQIYTFTVIADAEFLADENTVYPVYVDPTITLNTSAAIEDTVVYSGKPTHNYGDYNYLNVGYVDSSYGRGTLMVRFPTLANNSTFASLTGDRINSATLSMFTASGGSGTELLYMFIGSIDWTESTATYNSIANIPAPTQFNQQYVPSGGGVPMQFDLTNVVEIWADGTSYATPNKGIFVLNSGGNDPDQCRDFLSVEYALSSSSREGYMPNLEIEYVSTYTVIPNTTSATMCIEQTTFFDGSLKIDNNIWPNNGMLLRFSIPYENDARYIRLNNAITGSVTAIGITPSNYKATLRVYHSGLPYCYADIKIKVVSAEIKLGSPTNPITKFTINNDSPQNKNTQSRSCELSAYALTSNGISYDITYTFVDDTLGFPNTSINPYISVDVTPEGVVSYTIPYSYYMSSGELAHPVGEIIVNATCTTASRTITKNITIYVECSPMALPQGNSTSGIPLVGARYIQTPYSELLPYANTEMLRTLAINRGITYSTTNHGLQFERPQFCNNNDVQYYGSFENAKAALFNVNAHFWHTASVAEGINSYTQKFFELFRNSKIVCFNSHGFDETMSVNTNAGSTQFLNNQITMHKYTLTSEDIMLLHDGYFNYNKLIMLTTCSSGDDSYYTDSHSIAEAFVEKGAGCVVGFYNAVPTIEASDFEFTFLSHLCEGGSYYKLNNAIEVSEPGDRTFQAAFNKTYEILQNHLTVEPYIMGDGINLKVS